MPGPKRDISDEERRKLHNEYHNAYGKKLWKCDTCNIVIKRYCKTDHMTSIKHRDNEVPRWKCLTCNIEIPDTDAYKKKHSESKQHRAIETAKEAWVHRQPHGLVDGVQQGLPFPV